LIFKLTTVVLVYKFFMQVWGFSMAAFPVLIFFPFRSSIKGALSDVTHF